MKDIQKSVAKVFSIFLSILCLIVVAVFSGVSDLHAVAVNFHEQQESGEAESVLDLLREEDQLVDTGDTVTEQGQLRIEIPSEISVDSVEIVTDYMTRTVGITIPGISSSYFYDFPMVGSCDNIQDMTYETADTGGYIEITLDGIYELKESIDGRYIYLSFVDPHEVYDYIVVIDAGHGGRAPGATKQGVSEKDIDLAIVLALKEILDNNDLNIGAYYTRTDDSNPSFESRVGLANDLNADLFLSVHNNSTASGRMSSINGTEVMYKVSDETGASKAFAENCLNCLLSSLGSTSKGVVAGDEIYIIRTSEVPVALAEIGFMTNEEELAKLGTAEYQQQAAQGLYDAIVMTLGITQESETE